MDPRRWDLNQLLSAYLVTLKAGCKEEADWQRMAGQLAAEPLEVRQARLDGQRKQMLAQLEGRTQPVPQAPAQAGAMSADDAEAMLARMAAADAQYG